MLRGRHLSSSLGQGDRILDSDIGIGSKVCKVASCLFLSGTYLCHGKLSTAILLVGPGQFEAVMILCVQYCINRRQV